MKRIIIGILATVVALSASAQELNVASYNIKCGGSLRPGQKFPTKGAYAKFDGWDQRKHHLCDMINLESFDVFGAQEVRKNQLDDMVELLPDYKYVGVGRDDGKDKGEHCPIFYRKKDFKVVENGHFWLSETPDVPSYGWGAKHRRICTWALLQHKKSKTLFYFINTHVNWGKASAMSAHMLVDFAKKHCTKCDNIILMADFNAMQDSELYKIITSNGFNDTYEIAKYRFAPTGTGNGFRPNYFTHRRIDHIFVSEGIKTSRYGVLTYHHYRDKNSTSLEEMNVARSKDVKAENRDIRCISDHYPVQSFITLKK